MQYNRKKNLTTNNITDSMKLTPEIAKMILKPLQESGTPPKFGLEHFSTGFEDTFFILENFYLKDLIQKGGSTFKLISGNFGSGKTHFTYQFRELAWKNNYATCHITLNPKTAQFHKILTIYQAICERIQRPLSEDEKVEIFGELNKKEEFGIKSLVRYWYHKKQKEFEELYGEDWKIHLKKYTNTIRDFDSIYFGRVIRGMIESLMNEDLDKFDELTSWFENGPTTRHREFGIKKQLEADTFRMLNSLTEFLRNFMGLSGVVITFDETEGSTLRSSDQDRQMNTLRQVIDKCGDQSIQGIMFFYTVPNANDFFNKKNTGYDAIKQRLDHIFSQQHPKQAHIDLEKIIPADTAYFRDNLDTIGRKIAKLYEIAYDTSFTNTLGKSVANMIKASMEAKWDTVAVRRMFIHCVCQGLDVLECHGDEKEITLKMAEEFVGNSQEQFEGTDDDDEEL
jgi:hypothetical protein